jgi:CPA2 family monovalent cation:H+ antiporter-2
MNELRQILCPVDMSDVSGHAAAHAVLLSRWYQGRITALHVGSPLAIPASEFSLAGAGASALSVEQVQDLRGRIARIFDGMGAEVDVVVENGSTVTRILQHASSLPADLIVLGTHGASGFQHLVLGSVTEKVLRQATCPVLTVPPYARATSKLPYRRLLCPVDFSDSSLAALELAFSLAKEGDADLTILHVFEWPAEGEALNYRPMNVPEFHPQIEHDVSDRLRALVPEAANAWCRPSIRTTHGKPYREILGVATEDGADLVVMGVHGRNALDLMLFGSTTNQVIRRATCPVLTLRR